MSYEIPKGLSMRSLFDGLRLETEVVNFPSVEGLRSDGQPTPLSFHRDFLVYMQNINQRVIEVPSAFMQYGAKNFLSNKIPSQQFTLFDPNPSFVDAFRYLVMRQSVPHSYNAVQLFLTSCCFDDASLEAWELFVSNNNPSNLRKLFKHFKRLMNEVHQLKLRKLPTRYTTANVTMISAPIYSIRESSADVTEVTGFEPYYSFSKNDRHARRLRGKMQGRKLYFVPCTACMNFVFLSGQVLDALEDDPNVKIYFDAEVHPKCLLTEDLTTHVVSRFCRTDPTIDCQPCPDCASVVITLDQAAKLASFCTIRNDPVHRQVVFKTQGPAELPLCQFQHLLDEPTTFIEVITTMFAKPQGLVTSTLKSAQTAFDSVSGFFTMITNWGRQFASNLTAIKDHLGQYLNHYIICFMAICLIVVLHILEWAGYSSDIVGFVAGFAGCIIGFVGVYSAISEYQANQALAFVNSMTGFRFNATQTGSVDFRLASTLAKRNERDLSNTGLCRKLRPRSDFDHDEWRDLEQEFPSSAMSDRRLLTTTLNDQLTLENVVTRTRIHDINGHLDVGTDLPLFGHMQSSSFESLIAALGAFLNIKTWAYNLATMSSLFRGVRDMSSCLAFLFELIPFAIQNKILELNPHLLSTFLFKNSRWITFHSALDEHSERLKRPDAAIIAAAERTFKDAQKYVQNNCGQGWANHAETHLTKFASQLDNAKSSLQTIMFGRTPLMIVLGGAPGIGKTMAVDQLSTFLTGIHLGKLDPYRVYQPPPGEFWENIGNAVGIKFREFVGTGDENRLTDITNWMALADGAFKPNGASIEAKDKVYDFGFCVAATNQLYPFNIPTFHNYQALWRRAHFRIWVEIRPDWPQNRVDCMTRLHDMTEAEQSNFPHLRFRCLYPAPPNGCNIDEVNTGRNLENMIDPVMREYCNVRQYDAGNLSWTELLEVTFAFACDRQEKQRNLVQNQASAMKNIFDRLNAAEPAAEPLPVIITSKNSLLEFLLGLTLSAAASYALVRLGMTAYNHFFKKRSEEVASAQYGARPRGAHLVRQAQVLSKLRGTAQYGDPSAHPFDAFADRITRGVVTIVNEKTNMSVYGFLIDSQTILTVSHIIRNSNASIDYQNMLAITYPFGDSTMKKYVETHSTQLYFPQGEKHDILLIRLDCPIPGIRKSTQYFLQENEVVKLGTQEVHLERPDHTLTGNTLTSANTLRYDRMAPLTQKRVITYSIPTRDGDCGAPVWGMVAGQPKIFGIHVAGLAIGHGIFAQLNRSEFDSIPWTNTSVLDLDGTIQSGCLPDLFSEGEASVPEGNFAGVCRLTRPIATNSRTQLKKTPFCDSVAELPCRVLPAVLDSRIIPAQEEKYGIIRKPIPIDQLRWAEIASDHLYPVPSTPLVEWTIETAVNAIPSDASVGFGWNCKRIDLMPLVGEIHVPAEPLRKAIKRIFDITDQGIIPSTVIVPCLKDETLKIAKVESRLTRTFQISRIELLVLGTMVLGDYMEFLHADPISTPSTVGLDPASLEWDRLFRPLLDFDRDSIFLVDLDYKAMEANVLWQMFESYLRHTTRYYQDDGKPTWFRRKAYLMMMCQSYMAVGSSVYYRDHGNPSGMKGTTDLNTYAAGIFSAYAFTDNCPIATPTDFVDFIKSRYNGDDTVHSVRCEVRDVFNFFTVRDSLLKLNTVITPAVKDAEPSPNIDQEKVQFCKKQILYSDELNCLVPFVTFWTLLDQLSYARWAVEDDLVQIINSALQWSFFRGNQKENGQIPANEPTFDQQRAFFARAVPLLSHKLVSYDELRLRFSKPRAIVGYLPTLDFLNTHKTFDQEDFDDLFEFVDAELLGQMQSNQHKTNMQKSTIKKTQHHSTSENKTLIAQPQFGFDLGPFHLGFGEAPDMHGDTNPAPAPQTTSHGFIQDMVESGLDTAVDVLGGIMQGKTITTPSMAVRDGELLLPAFDAPQIAVNLDDFAATNTSLKPDHALGQRDELSHSFFAHLPVITESQDFLDAYTVPVELLRNKISPIDGDGQPIGDSVPVTITPLEYLCRNHAYWHGGMRYRLSIYGPREFSVRIAITFEYGRDAASLGSYDEAIQYPTIYHTFDSSSRDLTFEASDINPFRWKIRPDLLSTSVFGDDIRTCNGIMRVWQVSAVTGINIPLTSGPYMIMWKSGASDFAVQRFSPMPNMYINHPATLARVEKLRSEYVMAGGDLKDVIPSRALFESEPRPSAVKHFPQPVRLGTILGRIQSGPATDITEQVGGKVPEEEKTFAAPLLIAAAGTSVEAVAPQVAPTTEKTLSSSGVKNNTTKKIELTKLGAKFFQKEVFQLSVGDSADLRTWNVPVDFVHAQPALVIKTGRYFRGDLRVRFTTTASAFSGGMYLAYWVPYGVPSTSIDLLRASSLPHVEIDVSSNKPFDLFIPYSYYADYLSMDDITSVRMPIMGQIKLACFRYFQPTTAAKAVSMNVQYRWENLHTYVPITVPPCVTTFDAPTIDSRSRVQSRRRELLGRMQSGASAGTAGVENVTSMTTRDKSATHQEQRHKRAVAPLDINKIPMTSGSFVDQFIRPSLFYSGRITVDSRNDFYLELPPLLEPFDSSDGSGEGNIFDSLKWMYAGYRGDAVYDIIVRATGDTVDMGFSCGSIVSVDPIDFEGLAPQIPKPYFETDYYPSRLAVVTPPSDSYVVGSELPLTTIQFPGKFRVVVPYKAMTRYTPCQAWQGVNQFDISPIRGFIAFWNHLETSASFSIEVWRSPAPGSRLCQWTGMPPVAFDHVKNTLNVPPTNQYAGTFVGII